MAVTSDCGCLLIELEANLDLMEIIPHLIVRVFSRCGLCLFFFGTTVEDQGYRNDSGRVFIRPTDEGEPFRLQRGLE